MLVRKLKATILSADEPTNGTKNVEAFAEFISILGRSVIGLSYERGSRRWVQRMANFVLEKENQELQLYILN